MSFLQGLLKKQPCQTPSPVPLLPLVVAFSLQEGLVSLNDEHTTQELSTTIDALSVAPFATLSWTVPSTSVPSATSTPLDTFPSDVKPILSSFQDTTPLTMKEAPLTLKSEVVPQMYNGGNVTEIPFVDESSERELLSLLGDWYEPESFDSVFSSIASNARFFSS